MNEHPECLTTEQIKRFLDNARAPSREALAANAHLQDCARCRQALRSGAGRTVEQLLNRLVPEDDPVYPGDEAICLEQELLRRYVQGKTDACENEIVDLHLEDCAFCKADVTALQTLRRKMESERAPGLTGRLPYLWQHFWKRLVPISTKPVLAFSTGAVAAGYVLYAAFVLPLRTQLHNQKEAQQKQTQHFDTQLALLQNESQRAQSQLREQARIVSRSENALTNANSELNTLRRQRSLTLLPDSALLSLALESGRKNLQTVALDKSAEMGAQSKPETRVEPISPVSAIVEAQRPVLSWKALAGAEDYLVTMKNRDTDQEIEGSGRLTGTQWTPPHALARGTVYQWQVLAHVGKKEPIRSSSVPFKVLDAQTAGYLTEFAGAPLTRCTLCINAGMPAEAEKALQSYLQGNPDSPAVQQLHRTIKALKQKKQTFAQQGLQPR